MKIKPVEKSVETLMMEMATFYNAMLDTSEDEVIKTEIEPDFFENVKSMTSDELRKSKEKYEKGIRYTREEVRLATHSIAEIKAYNDSAIAEENFAKAEREEHQKATLKNAFEKSCLTVLTVGAKTIEENKKDPLSKQTITYDIKSILTYGALVLCLLNPITTVGITILLGYLGVRQINRLYHKNYLNKIDNRIKRLHILYDNGEKKKVELIKDREDYLAQISLEELYIKTINEELDGRASVDYSSPVLTNTETVEKVRQYRKKAH